MAQILPRNCPRCGTPTVEGRRFCANCGLPSSPPAFVREDQQTVWRASSVPKKRIGRGGLVLLLVALLLVVGAGLYVAAGAFGATIPDFGTTQSSITTTSLSTSFPYAGVDITLVNAQQAQNFLDDPN